MVEFEDFVHDGLLSELNTIHIDDVALLYVSAAPSRIIARKAQTFLFLILPTNARVRACERASMRACERASVRACGRASVRARERKLIAFFQ